MRIKNEKVEIQQNNVREFYKKRAEKYDETMPYLSTMLQDKQPMLAVKRDQFEKSLITPKLGLSSGTNIVDIGCGVARWADSLAGLVHSYVGIDFCEELLAIAKNRIATEHPDFNVSFFHSAFQNIADLNFNNKFNSGIVTGVSAYINDDDLLVSYQSLSQIMAPHSILYIKEPVGIEERLTLSNFYSQELNDDYHAIYRTVEQYEKLFSQTLLQNGFVIKESARFTDGELQNRAETAQHYFILERE